MGYAPYGVGIGDFNGDGLLDLAVSNGTDNTVSILLQSGVPRRVSVSLAADPNPAYVNFPVTYATVVSDNKTIPTGSVTFKYGSTILGTVTLSAGQASITTAFAKSGTFPIIASYSGDETHPAKNSKATKQVVNKYSTSTSLSSSPNPSTHNQAVTFAVKVASAGAYPTGKVVLMNGTTSLGLADLVKGVATLTRSHLPSGSLAITATYEGDVESKKSTSAVLVQVVN
jgi:hypothetical protein